MRTKAFLMAVAVMAASGGIAEAQVRPVQQARPGQYGGGLVEYLFSGRAMPARPVAMRSVQPAAYGSASSAGRPVYGDPMARYQLEPGAGPRRMASVQPRYGNPYEDAEPSFAGPDGSWRTPGPSYRAAAPIAHAPDPQFARQVVPFEGHQRPGTVVIDTQARHLYLVQPGRTAIRYGIGVGRPGFLWHGVKSVSAKKEWPDWTPPKEMLARRPDLPTFMAGGVENPLGARALYLGSSLYRIHGTNEPNTIGQAVSSGCIRMMNEDVIDLYDRTPVGSRVEVI